MKNNKGFIELKTVNDYWKKLQSDFNDLQNDIESTYIVFNFFVTVYHLIDWVFEGKYNDDRTNLNSKPMMKLCNHIANGIKHFEPMRHNFVKEIDKERYVEKGYVEEGYFVSPIIIYLEDNLKSDFGESIAMIDLANQVMSFWETELISRNLIE